MLRLTCDYGPNDTFLFGQGDANRPLAVAVAKVA